MHRPHEENKNPKFDLVEYKETRMLCEKYGRKLAILVKNEGNLDSPKPKIDPRTKELLEGISIKITYPGFGSLEDDEIDSWQEQALPQIKKGKTEKVTFSAPETKCFNPDAEFIVIIDEGGPSHFEIHDACFGEFRND